jgi:hypothetical protein
MAHDYQLTERLGLIAVFTLENDFFILGGSGVRILNLVGHIVNCSLNYAALLSAFQLYYNLSIANVYRKTPGLLNHFTITISVNTNIRVNCAKEKEQRCWT